MDVQHRLKAWWNKKEGRMCSPPKRALTWQSSHFHQKHSQNDESVMEMHTSTSSSVQLSAEALICLGAGVTATFKHMQMDRVVTGDRNVWVLSHVDLTVLQCKPCCPRTAIWKTDTRWVRHKVILPSLGALASSERSVYSLDAVGTLGAAKQKNNQPAGRQPHTSRPRRHLLTPRQSREYTWGLNF